MLHRIRPLTRRSYALASGLLALATITAFVLLLNGSGETAKANAPAPPSYSALNSTEPTGLPVATIGSPSAKALGTKGPVFPANLSRGSASSGPVAASIRKVPVSLPGVSAWIARSAEGGICVLASRNHPVIDGIYGLGMSCAPAGSDSGATLELQPDGSGSAVIVGVVPDDVSSVQMTLSNGVDRTVTTDGNGWALESDANIEIKQDVVGG